MQVLQGEGATGSRASNAFDEQKEALMSSLFQLMLVNKGAKRQDREHSRGGEGDQPLRDSQEEVNAARELGFLPLCAPVEALQMSAESQPPAPQRVLDWRKHGLVAFAMQAMSRALVYLPARIARALLAAMSVDVQMSLMAKMPGLDLVFLSMKILAEGHQWWPGSVPAARMLYLSPLDEAFCKWLARSH